MQLATITIKNSPDQLYKKLKNRAKSNIRSINCKVVNLLSKELAGTHFIPVKVMEAARISQEWAKVQLTEAQIQQSQEAGRS